jgi:biopolymer transport protein ExbD
MRFKKNDAPPPELNLVPMLDVLMTVLTFFIVVSMTLTLQLGVEVELPNSAENAPPPTDTPDPLIVQLDAQSEISINNQSVNKQEMDSQLQAYLDENPKGFVVLQAEPDMPYQEVVETLARMRKVGGKRVSLAIE